MTVFVLCFLDIDQQAQQGIYVGITKPLYLTGFTANDCSIRFL